MNDRKASEHVVKNNNKGNNTFINLLLSAKQLVYFFLSVTVFTFAAVITVNAASDRDQTETDSVTFLSLLQQCRDLPVEYLSAVYVADAKLNNELSKHRVHPFFSVLKATKKLSLSRKPFHVHSAFDHLNDLIPYSEGVEYINQKKMTQLIKIPLFHWLLKEYGSFGYLNESGATAFLTMTIGGALYDLKCRAKKDPVVKLVLEFLDRPVKSMPAEPVPTHHQSVFTRYSQYLSQLFSSMQTAPSFSFRLALLTDSPHTEEQVRQEKLIKLRIEGYGYKKDYLFTSYESDENGTEKAVVSDDIILPEQKSQKLIDADYPLFNSSYRKSSVTSGLGAAALFSMGLYLLPSASAYRTFTTPGMQCSIDGRCGLQDYQFLNNDNFYSVLSKNSTGCFSLSENITLNTQYNLPFFKSCSSPFSGVLKTNDHTINSGNNTSAVFGCMNQAVFTGNVNLCVGDSVQTGPVIAEQVLHNNTLTIQQANICEVQNPALGDITGDQNRVIFTGVPGQINTKNGTGVIATHVSGNQNIITIQKSKLHNAPVTFAAGGHNNTYYQKDMDITKVTDSSILDSKFLLADSFPGSKTTIIQENVNANFITPGAHAQGQNLSAVHGEDVNAFAVNSFIRVNPAPETVRITNGSDNSVHRSVIKDSGRLEVYRDNKWQSVCEGTLTTKTAHAACKSLGFTEANETKSFALRNVLTINKLESDPVHINRTCTGYEQHLQQCNVTSTHTHACPENREALLSCSDKPAIHNPNLLIRLTDHTSNDPYRFDTTNTGTGRLEYSERDTHYTFCSHGFTAANAKVACSEMGFYGGQSVFPPSVPLNKAINPFAVQRECLGDESKLIFCPLTSVNAIAHNCTHQDDVILKCNPQPLHPDPITFRLTDRYSIDESRANVSTTGIGRLEMLVNNNNISEYISFCSDNIAHQDVQLVCKQFGFDGGGKFYLTAEPLPPVVGLDSENGRGRRLLCLDTLASCTSVQGFFNACSEPVTNVILWCTHSDFSRNNVQQIPEDCSQTPTMTTLFSGQYNITSNCNLQHCPLKHWNVHSTKISDNLYQLCDSEQRLNTINPDDWLKIWGYRCATKNNCNSCHIPGEKTLGLVADDNRSGQRLLISSQAYPDDTELSDGQRFIIVNRLSSEDSPQILRPVNQMLAADACPVNHIVTEQQLLGLYSTNNSTGGQLFWSSLQHNSRGYYVKTLPGNGKFLLLTNGAIFVQDANSSLIRQYPLSKITDDNNRVTFNIDNAVHENITLPKQVNNVFTVVSKQGQLHLATTLTHDKVYLAATNGDAVKQIYVMSYDIDTELWSQRAKSVNGITSDNIHHYNMVVDNDDQIRFFHREEISIPEIGGCVSIPMEILMAVQPQPQPQPKPQDSGEQSNKNIFAVLAAIPCVFAASTASGYILHRVILNKRLKKKKPGELEDPKYVKYSWGSLKSKGSYYSNYSFSSRNTGDSNTYYNYRMKMSDSFQRQQEGIEDYECMNTADQNAMHHGGSVHSESNQRSAGSFSGSTGYMEFKNNHVRYPARGRFRYLGNQFSESNTMYEGSSNNGATCKNTEKQPESSDKEIYYSAPPAEDDIYSVPPEEDDIYSVPPEEGDIYSVPPEEGDIYFVPPQPQSLDTHGTVARQGNQQTTGFSPATGMNNTKNAQPSNENENTNGGGNVEVEFYDDMYEYETDSSFDNSDESAYNDNGQGSIILIEETDI